MVNEEDKKVLKAVLYSPKQLRMMADIAGETGLDSFTGNVHYCLIQTWKKMFPNYMRSINDTEMIEKKVTAKMKSKELIAQNIKDKALEKGTKYCEEVMLGKVSGNICHYKQYAPTTSNDSDEQCPLHFLGDIVTEKDCFYPSKELVLEHRKDVVKLFKQKV